MNLARTITTRLVCQNSVLPAPGGVSYAGYLANSVGVSSKPMRIWGRYAVAYVVNGFGRYGDTNSAEQPIRAGDLIFVFPELPHYYGPLPGDPWDEFYIVFDGPIFHTWREAGLISSTRPVHHLEPIDYWLHRLVTAAGESTGGDTAQGLAGLIRMQQLLADIATADSTDHDWLSRAKGLIDAQAMQPAGDLSTIAEQLGIGYEAFRKRFTRLAGITPNRYHTGRIMDRAGHMLTQPDMVLKNIAEACGFCDEFHFSKRFKQVMGVTPSDFRRRLHHG